MGMSGEMRAHPKAKIKRSQLLNREAQPTKNHEAG